MVIFIFEYEHQTPRTNTTWPQNADASIETKYHKRTETSGESTQWQQINAYQRLEQSNGDTQWFDF